MIRRDARFLFSLLIVFTAIFAFTGGDCTTESEPGLIAPPQPPTGLNFSLGAVTGGRGYAIVTWNASTSENREDFRGYRVSTYSVDSSGSNINLLNDTLLNKPTHTFTVNDILPGTRYKTYVVSVLTDGTEGNDVETSVYGGVYYNSNGAIDEFMESGPAMSGYGWDPFTGNGTQYASTEENLPSIDLILSENDGQLTFYSPASFTGDSVNNVTNIDTIGSGITAFAATNLQEPTGTTAPVRAGTVYLLKIDTNYYVKVWVKSIEETGDPVYFHVTFEYKVQPIEGLRILKR